jgi:hypothetical protein
MGCTFIASTATTTTTTTYNLTRMVCTWCETSFTTAENDQEATTCCRHTSPTRQDIGTGSTSQLVACQCRVPPPSLSLWFLIELSDCKTVSVWWRAYRYYSLGRPVVAGYEYKPRAAPRSAVPPTRALSSARCCYCR